jgi:hypothetical protein
VTCLYQVTIDSPRGREIGGDWQADDVVVENGYLKLFLGSGKDGGSGSVAAIFAPGYWVSIVQIGQCPP